MSVAPKMCPTPCETCAKEGLPLLLTRYAVMPADIKAPVLGGNLLSPVLNGVRLGDSARYGLRLLRSGYVYVFDEARTQWDEYFVTADGFLTKVPPRIKALKVQRKPQTEFQCARNGAAPLAGVITIRNPRHAKNIWIGFSDVEWTDQVFADHQSPEHRKQHMSCIVITGGKVANQPDTAPVEEVEKWITEFKLSGSVEKRFDEWCPHRYNSRAGMAGAVVQAAKKMLPDGGAAIVALHDPVGLVQEIAFLMEVRKQAFIQEERHVKPRFAAHAIASLEAAVRNQARLSEVLAGEELAQREERGLHAWNPNMALANETGDPVKAEQWRTHTPQSLQRVADAKWRAYTHRRNGEMRFDQRSSQEWLSKYHEQFRAFDSANIAPLARAHAEWMKHPRLASCMKCNFDSKDLSSGAVYTATVAQLLRHTADKRMSYELYVSWLIKGDFAAGNLVMRALGLNNDELIAAIQKVDSPPLDGRAFPTDAVMGGIASHLEKVSEEARRALGDLMDGLSGAATKYWNEFHEGRVGHKAAAALAVASGKQFVRVPVVGTKGDFVQALVEQLYKLDPDLKVKTNDLSKAVAAQRKLLEVEGVKMGSKSSLGWYVVLDKDVVKKAGISGLKGQALADYLKTAIVSPAALKELEVAGTLRATTAGRFSTGATVLGGILMVFNYTKLVEDAVKGMSHETSEAVLRLHAGTAAIAGFAMEQVAAGLKKLGDFRLKNAPGLTAWRTPSILRIGGRLLGAGAGIFVGFLDLSKWWDERKQGNPSGLAGWYFASGALGVSLAFYVLFAAAFGIFGWILLLGVLFVAAFVELNKENKVQEWLSRSHFGLGADKYADATLQEAQYNLATE
ncbi:hypothetical protein LRS03_25405 [Rhizobacter sp. J219]|uniref:T6SS effector BTH_I2691 family protein n=1 Tax=Rhizobacter sp. J219 TaxID=2898430 RepID=UPI002151207B|nr:T6SS effector BTH_I2691 family protein [Rhizobacter sp. J219]MCR5886004.1 hypothetical protein [Rhizobacter sp. J219]